MTSTCVNAWGRLTSLRMTNIGWSFRPSISGAPAGGAVSAACARLLGNGLHLDTSDPGAGPGRDSERLVHDGIGGRTGQRASGPPRLGRCVSSVGVPGDKHRVRPFSASYGKAS